MITSRVFKIALLGVALFTLSCLLCLAGCKPQGNELPFKTIERGNWPDSYEKQQKAKEPGMSVISTLEDVTRMEGFFTRNAQVQLRELDFEAAFALTVFFGTQPDPRGGQIQRIVRRGNSIAVYAQVGVGGPEDEETLPYHLVKVTKEGDWAQTMHFTLYLDGKETASVSRFIPC